MSRHRSLVLILTIVGFSGTTAGASAITYQAEQLVVDGPLNSSGGLTSNFALNPSLPDLTAGGSVTIGLFTYENSTLPASEITSQSISGGFNFPIRGYDSAGNAVGPLIGVDGRAIAP